MRGKNTNSHNLNIIEMECLSNVFLSKIYTYLKKETFIMNFYFCVNSKQLYIRNNHGSNNRIKAFTNIVRLLLILLYTF